MPTSAFFGFGVRGTAYGADLWGCLVFQTGWPLSSGEHAIEFMEVVPGGTLTKVTPHRALSMGRLGTLVDPDRMHVPLHPLWHGVVINTFFYAASLWLLFAAPFALRRHLRRRAGRCPSCGYPVGASIVCTECGKSVKPKPAEAAL